jgi:hypothetical protein
VLARLSPKYIWSATSSDDADALGASSGSVVPLQHSRHIRSRAVYSLLSPFAMDITKFVTEFRESAFLLGDYSTYRAQVSRRLRIVQKKLGRATPKNAKYAAKAPVTAEDVGKNIEYVGCVNCL